uniref:G-protein coupled receptors family 1 profile domain-containing protein n=1 Tax=Monopterus albus TaxID=43700 RepID=A0A3Q3J5T7_MONAL|nr:alpha-1A adrenergic receptor-like [Monopterus albus]
MSLWTNDSFADLYAGTQSLLPGFNSSNRSDGFQHRGQYGAAAPLDLGRAVPVGMVLASFIMFAIVGNILVILSVVCNRHLRIPTNYFIINLAIADLLLGTTVLPVSATREVLDYWVFGRIFCDIWAAVDVLCCTASIMSLCVISIDRYIGVRYPLQYQMIVTEKRALLAMLAVWILAIVISIGPLLGWKQPPSQDDTKCQITEEPFYTLFSSLGSFYIPLAVILAMYCRVYIVAKRTTRNLEAGMMKECQEDSNELTLRIHCRNQQVHELCTGASAGRSTLSVKLLKFSREKKAAKTLGMVVGMFILCWLPFFLVLPIGSFNSRLRPPETCFKVIFWLGYFNSCLNPIIYPCYSREFKQAFIRILRCRWKTKRQGWQAYYNYRCHQGSNSSSFLNGSQQTLSSISPSPRCVASRLQPPSWPSSSSGRHLLPGSAERGRQSQVSPLAKDAGMGVGAGGGVVMNGQSVNREEEQQCTATPSSQL